MAAAVEAKSLSSLTALAANPPLYPENLATIRNEALVLYISRVPGSKDVFLTPIKPRQKVVTAEDVESSLYYLHVHVPEDESLVEPVPNAPQDPRVACLLPELYLRPDPEKERHGQSPSSTYNWTPNKMPPKPLPPVPPGRENQEWGVDGRRLPGRFASNLPPSAAELRPNCAAGLSLRKNVPSRANVDASSYQSSMKRAEESGAHSQHYSRQENPPTYDRAVFQDPQKDLAPNASLAEKDSLEERSTRLTLIRRDPASSAQWNVATIVDRPVFEVGSDGRYNSMTGSLIKKSGQPLYIEVTNPGYAKFSSGPLERSPSPASNGSSATLSGSAHSSTQSKTVFRRRMWMEGSMLENLQSGHRKAVSSDSTSSPYHRSARLDDGSEGDFSQLSDNTGLVRDPVMHTISINGDRKRSHLRGYTLMSPWHGRCEFSSAGMGSSLKCRHSLPRNGLHGDTSYPVTASELRFNLPGGGPLAGQLSTKPATDTIGHRKPRFFHSSRHLRLSASMDSTPRPRTSESASPSNDSRLDLSLGQELAGGGFAGKQAKLGKLIIEDEGLKMMDLLVAANLGLWWRAYEKG